MIWVVLNEFLYSVLMREDVYNLHSFVHFIPIRVLVRILTQKNTLSICTLCFLKIFTTRNLNLLIFCHYCSKFSSFFVKLLYNFSFNSPLIPFHQMNLGLQTTVSVFYNRKSLVKYASIKAEYEHKIVTQR